MVAAMALRNRVERLEQETRFKDWLRFQRYLESLSDEQLEFFAVFGFWLNTTGGRGTANLFEIWRARRDSNSRPTAPEAAALSS
jgi:hypothetical protein